MYFNGLLSAAHRTYFLIGPGLVAETLTRQRIIAKLGGPSGLSIPWRRFRTVTPANPAFRLDCQASQQFP
ncbi:hypothetical protein BLA15816_07509 [Burkholderia lata]|nr:hypothetical protein BLA15816_07509 [Burkholderia lata]